MGYFPVRYDSRVIIYERKMFIILATGLLHKEPNCLTLVVGRWVTFKMKHIYVLRVGTYSSGARVISFCRYSCNAAATVKPNLNRWALTALCRAKILSIWNVSRHWPEAILSDERMAYSKMRRGGRGQLYKIFHCLFLHFYCCLIFCLSKIPAGRLPN